MTQDCKNVALKLPKISLELPKISLSKRYFEQFKGYILCSGNVGGFFASEGGSCHRGFTIVLSNCRNIAVFSNRKCKIAGFQGAAKGGRQKEFDHFSFSGLFRSLFGHFFWCFCHFFRHVFAKLLLPDSFCGRVRFYRGKKKARKSQNKSQRVFGAQKNSSVSVLSKSQRFQDAKLRAQRLK